MVSDIVKIHQDLQQGRISCTDLVEEKIRELKRNENKLKILNYLQSSINYNMCTIDEIYHSLYE